MIISLVSILSKLIDIRNFHTMCCYSLSRIVLKCNNNITCFFPGENKRWDAYVHSQAKRWLSMIDKWVVNSNHHPILVVKYEKLKRESFTEVIRMLDFLRIDYNHMELKNNVKEDFNLFFRKKNKVNFEHYTKKQITCISSIIRNATMLLNKNNIGELIELEEYYSLYNT